MKLWQKGQNTNKEIEKFTVGNDYLLDQNLVKYDCIASIGHAKMLRKIGILSDSELKKLEKELKNIIELEKKGQFKIKLEDEDCHTAIENHLTKKLGELGKKIHTARSRNDQVLGALRLFEKNELKEIEKFAQVLESELKSFARKENSLMPGFTHTRKAMPSSVGLWAGAFAESMNDNIKLLKSANALIDQSPLGSAAGYGVSLNIPKEFTAKQLSFAKVQNNSLYVQNSRGKFEGTILNALSQIMLDLNKMSTDLIMFSMPEFNYFELPKEFCTGSSIMPQKKNPDVLELVRAKYAVMLSYEFQVKTIIANLISGYNRDFQLTKEPIMKGLYLVKSCLSIMVLVIKNLKVNKEACKKAMTSELFATEKAYKLVKQGYSFRDAYHKVKEELNKC
ncbi:MAG: argininosuccinate lyase [Nanoarchaeota archaeon]|nr:argininosuccinate lyase [Nanoarchaeota archaeon]